MPKKKTSTSVKRKRKYSGRVVAIPRTDSYADTIALVRKAFCELQDASCEQIQLFIKLEKLDNLAQVVQEPWAELLPSLSLVKVVSTAPPSPPNDVPPNDFIHIQVEVVATATVRIFNVPRACKVSRLKRKIRELMRPDLNEGEEDKLRLFHDGHLLGDLTLQLAGVEDGDSIDVHQEQTGGKPVIYLFSPSPLSDVQVQLSLVKAWRFSAIYPPTPITLPSDESLGETISWSVDTRLDGTLFDRSTNRQVAYLFWEAHTNPEPLISPPTTPSADLVLFDPARPTINPDNSAFLPFDKVTGYIDDALLAMELHAEARTSFITYWLPGLSKHSHVALRFLPRDQYEASAPLDVTPMPDITTRVFMLFMGVQESDLGAWGAAQVPAEEWSRMVGVDRVRAKDASLFRVLEWGGMEIR